MVVSDAAIEDLAQFRRRASFRGCRTASAVSARIGQPHLRNVVLGQSETVVGVAVRPAGVRPG